MCKLQILTRLHHITSSNNANWTSLQDQQSSDTQYNNATIYIYVYRSMYRWVPQSSCVIQATSLTIIICVHCTITKHQPNLYFAYWLSFIIQLSPQHLISLKLFIFIFAYYIFYYLIRLLSSSSPLLLFLILAFKVFVLIDKLKKLYKQVLIPLIDQFAFFLLYYILILVVIYPYNCSRYILLFNQLNTEIVFSFFSLNQTEIQQFHHHSNLSIITSFLLLSCIYI